jgi:ParB/RepB/Spo0J family partition protein
MSKKKPVSVPSAPQVDIFDIPGAAPFNPPSPSPSSSTSVTPDIVPAGDKLPKSHAEAKAQKEERNTPGPTPEPTPEPSTKLAKQPRRASLKGPIQGTAILGHPLVPKLTSQTWPPREHVTQVFRLSEIKADLAMNSRLSYDPVALQELADSIRDEGLTHLATVEMREDGPHLVAGFRRYLALLSLGCEEHAFSVKLPLSEAERIMINWSENVNRADLHPCEASAQLKKMQTLNGWSGRMLAVKVHMSTATVTRLLALGNLEPSLWKEFASRDPQAHGGLTRFFYEISGQPHETQLKKWAQWLDRGGKPERGVIPDTTGDDDEEENEELGEEDEIVDGYEEDDGEQNDNDADNADDGSRDHKAAVKEANKIAKDATPKAGVAGATGKRPSSDKLKKALTRARNDRSLDDAYRKGVVSALRWALGEQKKPPVTFGADA